MASSNDDVHPDSSTSAVIIDGTVTGVLPSAGVFAVNYPGYPSSIDRAIETLGGLPAIAKTRSLESNNMELRFRPEDPYCHPVSGLHRHCTGLLLRVSKTKGTSSSTPDEPKNQLSAKVVARVNHGYYFEGMADYQHVLPVHAAEASRKKRQRAEEAEMDSGDDNVDPDPEDVLMLVPEFFSHKNMPENLVLTPSVNLFSKSIQKGVVEHRWEMDIEPCLAIAFHIERIPSTVKWEDNLQKDSEEWEWQIAVSKLFDERLIWPRWSLNERLLGDGIRVTVNQLKRLLFRSGYYFSTGPFGRFWIKKGYDPRTDPESRIFQKVDFRMPPQLRNIAVGTDAKVEQTYKDICQFRVFPSKTFVCLQFFELVDDFIQQEIKKPPMQATCSHATGWFSKPMLQTLRMHVCVRFLSIFPKSGAEALLKSKCEFLERFKKLEALSRFWEPEKEHINANKDSNNSPEVPYAIGSGHEGGDGPANGELEDEEEEEEEEELDGYESPPVAAEDDTFALDADSYGAGESIPNNYLQELLRGFPFSEDGKDSSQPTVGVQSADSSDSEYKIFEQDSDGDDSS